MSNVTQITVNAGFEFPEKRKAGYYWVKYKHPEDKFIIGKWDRKCWETFDSETYGDGIMNQHQDSEFSVIIEERIPTPDEICMGVNPITDYPIPTKEELQRIAQMPRFNL